MKSLLKFLILFIFLASITNATSYSESWFNSGNAFNLDNLSFTIYLQGSGNSTKILLKNNINPDFSEILNLNQCIYTLKNKVCFEDQESIPPNPTRVKAVFYEIIEKMNITTTITPNETFIKDTLEVEIELIKDGDVSSLTLLVPLIEDISVSYVKGCKLIKNSSGQFLKMTKDSVSNSEICSFKLYSKKPVEFEIASKLTYEQYDELVTTYTSPEKIEFKFPFEHSIVNTLINVSEDFQYNITLKNPSSDKVTFRDVRFYFPNEIEIGEISSPSDLSPDMHYISRRSFTLDPDEERVIPFDLLSEKEGNFILFFIPEFKYKNEWFENQPSIVWNLSIYEIGSDDDDDDYDENEGISFDCNNLIINESINASTEYLSGTELDFRIYLRNYINISVKNITATLTQDGTEIGKKFFDIFKDNEKALLSQVYSIVPTVPSDSKIVYKTTLNYICNGSSVTTSQELGINVSPFVEITLTSDAPSTIEFGERIKIEVEIENEDDLPVDNIIIKDLVPSDFKVIGNIERSISLQGDQKLVAYSYFIEPIVNLDKDVDIKTVAILQQGNYQKLVNITKLISLESINLTYLNITVETESIRSYEPEKIKLLLKNTYDESLEDITVSILRSGKYDLQKDVDFFYPLILPNQTFYIELPIFAKDNNISLSIQTLFSKGKQTDSLNLSIKNNVVDFPYVVYNLTGTFLLNKSYEAKITVFNPSEFNATFNYNEKYVVPKNETMIITEVFSSKEDAYLVMSYFDMDFLLDPISETDSFETAPEVNDLTKQESQTNTTDTNNNSESNSNDDSTESPNIDTETKDSSSDNLQTVTLNNDDVSSEKESSNNSSMSLLSKAYSSLGSSIRFFLWSLIILGIIFILSMSYGIFLILKSNNIFKNKPNKTKKALPNIKENPVGTQKVKTAKYDKILESPKLDPIKDSSEEIKTSNIMSFNEYEQLKEKLK